MRHVQQAPRQARYASVAFGLALLMLPLAHAAPPPERQAELMRLLQQDCGACHGLTRKGGLGPSLLPGALASKPDALLVNTVLAGRPGTPMPPWRLFLNEEEALWLVEALRAGEGL
jgi:cytochrome c55X